MLSEVRNPPSQTFYNKGFFDVSRFFGTLYADSPLRQGQTPVLIKYFLNNYINSNLTTLCQEPDFQKLLKLDQNDKRTWFCCNWKCSLKDTNGTSFLTKPHATL